MIYNGKEENRKTEIFTNFTMTITKEYKIDNKLCYSGYLVILNMTTSNETDSNIEAGFDLFNSSSTKKNLRNLKSDDQIDDVDAVSFCENVRGHFRVPSSCLVTKVYTSFKKLLH